VEGADVVYTVVITTKPGKTGSTTKTKVLKKNRLVMGGLHPSTMYGVKVTAKTTQDGDIDGESVQFKTGETKEVEGVQVSDVTTNSAQVQWTKIDGVKKYFVSMQCQASYPGGYTKEEMTTDRYIVLTGIPAGSECTVKVQADYAGVRSEGTEAKFTTDPIKVVNIKVSQITSSSAKLTWELNSKSHEGMGRYRVRYVDKTNGGEAKTVEVDQPKATLTGLKPETTYEVIISPPLITGGGNRDDSESVTFRTLELENHKKPVTNLKISNIKSTSAKVTWDSPGDNLEFLITYTANNGEKRTKTTSQTTVVLEGLAPETNYEIKVAARKPGEEQTGPEEVQTFSTLEEPKKKLPVIGLTVSDVTSTTLDCTG
jgi:chitodextrinase